MAFWLSGRVRIALIPPPRNGLQTPSLPPLPHPKCRLDAVHSASRQVGNQGAFYRFAAIRLGMGYLTIALHLDREVGSDCMENSTCSDPSLKYKRSSTVSPSLSRTRLKHPRHSHNPVAAGRRILFTPGGWEGGLRWDRLTLQVLGEAADRAWTTPKLSDVMTVMSVIVRAIEKFPF
uniref:Uncharacterized protein n=1 Tax=Mesocestoides corti TaxID=53468 RepID=A0A5K3FV71_MESCO